MPLPLKDRKKSPKPTKESIASLLQAASLEFSERDAMDARRDRLYWQENPIPHPSYVSFQPVHLGVATEVINRLVGILDDFPTTQIFSTSVSDLVLKRAQKAEDFSNTLFPAMQEDRDEDVWGLILEDTLRFGRGYDQVLYVPQRWSTSAPDFPSAPKNRSTNSDDKDYGKTLKAWKMRAKLPVVWRHLPARNTFTWRDDFGMSEAVTVTRRRVKDLLNQYNLKDLQKQADADPVLLHSYAMLAEYWSRDWGAYWVSRSPADDRGDVSERSGVEVLRDAEDGELAEVFPNIYGYIPIVETPGLSSSSQSRSRRQMSVLDHMMPICEYLDQLVSQKASAVRVWAWPTPYLKNLSVGNMNMGSLALNEDGRPPEIEIEPGKMLTLLPGEDIGWLVVPESGAGADELIDLIQKQADGLGISSAMFNSGALGSNGYLYNSVMNAIRSKYSPVLKHVKNAHTQRVQHMFRLLEMVGEPLYLFKHGDGRETVGEWITMKPEEAREAFYTIDVQYEDRLPTDDAGNMGLAVQATQGEHPLMDRNAAREQYLHDKSPERTEQRVRIQKYMDRPEIEDVLVKQAVKEFGLLQEEQATPMEEVLAGLSPEEVATLPPPLLQALGIAPPMGSPMGAPMGGGGPPPMPEPFGAMPPGRVGDHLAAPSVMGGIAGGPAAPVLPGINHPLVPAPPAPSRAPRPQEPHAPPGRARGYSRKPAQQRRAGKP